MPRRVKYFNYTLLLWTINDFPAYNNLSGWSIKGKLLVHYVMLILITCGCNIGYRRFLPTGHVWRKKKFAFDGREDNHMSSCEVMGEDALEQLWNIIPTEFSKGSRKRKRVVEELNWTKSSIFFQLPYW